MRIPVPVPKVEDSLDMVVNLLTEYGAVDGEGRSIAWLPSMRTTCDMVGLVAGSS